MTFKKKITRFFYIIASILIVLTIASILFLNSAQFGKLPSGNRLERIKNSPNYRNDAFENRSATTLMASDKSMLQSLWEFMFTKVDNLIPTKPLPTIKTDLVKLSPQEDLLLWMGHSSLYLQLDGKRIVFDPVLVSASPIAGINKAFPGTETYQPNDLPVIDMLVLTHDHWDHLDYKTMIALKDRIKAVVCPLGVGAHLEYWGFDPNIIQELDWNEQTEVLSGIKITALPARHFSGRGLTSNQTLWAGYMLQSSFGNILLSGDTGYDTHFQAIKKKFDHIDFAIMENGQYNEDWRYIHMLPEDLAKALDELQPTRFMTVHHSKYALARHAWYEPLQKIAETATKNNYKLLTPKIGEPVFLRDSTQTFTNWWEDAR